MIVTRAPARGTPARPEHPPAQRDGRLLDQAERHRRVLHAVGVELRRSPVASRPGPRAEPQTSTLESGAIRPRTNAPRSSLWVLPGIGAVAENPGAARAAHLDPFDRLARLVDHRPLDRDRRPDLQRGEPARLLPGGEHRNRPSGRRGAWK